MGSPKRRVYGSWEGTDPDGESLGIYANGEEKDALAHFFREWLEEADDETVASIARQRGFRVALEEEA